MKITVTYEVTGATVAEALTKWPSVKRDLTGPLQTGIDAANRQLDAEGSRLRIHLCQIKQVKS